MDQSPNYEPVDQIYSLKERAQSIATAAGLLAVMYISKGTIRLVQFFDNRQEVRHLGPEFLVDHTDTVANE